MVDKSYSKVQVTNCFRVVGIPVSNIPSLAHAGNVTGPPWWSGDDFLGCQFSLGKLFGECFRPRRLSVSDPLL